MESKDKILGAVHAVWFQFRFSIFLFVSFSLNVFCFSTVNPHLQVCLKWAKNHPRHQYHMLATPTTQGPRARYHSVAPPPHLLSLPPHLPPPHRLSTNLPPHPPDDWRSAYLPWKSSLMEACPCSTPRDIRDMPSSLWCDIPPMLVWTL